MINNQTTRIFFQILNLIDELRIARKINLKELVLKNEIFSDLWQVIKSSFASFTRMSH